MQVNFRRIIKGDSKRKIPHYGSIEPCPLPVFGWLRKARDDEEAVTAIGSCNSATGSDNMRDDHTTWHPKY